MIPLLVAAGLQAFGRGIAIREVVKGDRLYVDDIQPSLIERICENPTQFELETYPFTDRQIQNLETMIGHLAGKVDPQEPDPVRGLYDALLSWRNAVPRAALHATGLGKAAEQVQPLLRDPMMDPLDLILRKLPEAIDQEALSAQFVRVFCLAIDQLNSVIDSYAHRAAAIAAEVFNSRIPGRPLPLLQAAETWAAFLPQPENMRIGLDREAQGILSHARNAQSSSRGERGLSDVLSTVLLGKGLEEWNERTVSLFRERLEATAMRLEARVLERADSSMESKRFVEHYLSNLLVQLSHKVGRDAVGRCLQEFQEMKP